MKLNQKEWIDKTVKKLYPEALGANIRFLCSDMGSDKFNAVELDICFGYLYNQIIPINKIAVEGTKHFKVVGDEVSLLVNEEDAQPIEYYKEESEKTIVIPFSVWFKKYCESEGLDHKKVKVTKYYSVHSKKYVAFDADGRFGWDSHVVYHYLHYHYVGSSVYDQDYYHFDKDMNIVLAGDNWQTHEEWENKAKKG